MELDKKEIELQAHKQDPEDDSENKVYTLDEVMAKIGFGPFQMLITLFCGLLLIADATEFMLLAILSPVVKCQWKLSGVEEALISSIVFLGVLLGAPFWGVIFDLVGRKKGLFAADLVILLCGLLSALSLSIGDEKLPGYPWLLLCRFGVGFGAGGAFQAVTYYIEFLPPKARGITIALLGVWWSMGTIIGTSVAIGVMGRGGLGWHWYLGFCAIPLALVLPLFLLVPESARYYLVKGKTEQVQKVIERIAFYNCKEPPKGRIVTLEEKEKLENEIQDKARTNESSTDYVSSSDSSNDLGNNRNRPKFIKPKGSKRGYKESKSLISGKAKSSYSITLNIYLIFTGGMWKTTVILMLMWLGSGWLYYGSLFLTTSLIQDNPHCYINNSSNRGNDICQDEQLDRGDYLEILWTTAAEFPGLIIVLILIDILGRKWTMAIQCVASTISFLLLFVCSSKIVLSLFLFLIRAFTSGLFKTVHIYTTEIYPTYTRAFGIGFCSFAARIGGILTPYFAQVLLYTSFEATILIYAGSCLVMAVLALVLPIETKGRALHDTGKN